MGNEEHQDLTPNESEEAELNEQPNEPGEADAVQKFTQEQVEEIVKKRIAETKASVQSAILEELGVQDLNGAKEVLTAKREAEDAERTDLERAQIRITELESQVSELETLKSERTKFQAFTAQLLEGRTEGLPKGVSQLLEALPDDLARLEWLEENSEEFTKRKAPDNGARSGGKNQPGPVKLTRKISF